MVRPDILAAGKIGYRAGHLQYTVICAGAHIELFHGALQQPPGCFVEAAIALCQARCHLGIAVHAGLAGIAFGLDISGSDYPPADVGTALSRRPAAELLEIHRQYFHLYVDSVEQRPRYLDTAPGMHVHARLG